MSGPAAAQAAILTRRDDLVGWIILNRPAKRNALNAEMRAGLTASLAEMEADDAVRVVVLTGEGPAFCAGADLADGPAAGDGGTTAGDGGAVAGDGGAVAGDGGPVPGGGGPVPGGGRVPAPRTGRPMAARARPVAESLAAFSKPLIAAINGPAMGGGLELALACDVRVAADGARFGLPEARIGSLPGSGGTQRLMRAIPSALAARMLLTGEALSAEDALRAGLISDLVEPGALAGFAAGLARQIAGNAPLSLRAVKQCLIAARETPLAAGLELERTLWTLLATTRDRQEGRAAFREHRSPRFSGN